MGIFRRTSLVFLIACSLCTIRILAQPTTEESYPPHPDSLEQPGVPKGELLQFTFENSKIYPGTFREYSIYVPAQYKSETPACVWVAQDGPTPGAKANIVFDNLIHKKVMPITIGIFVGHGRVRAPTTNASDRMNRSYEYDSLGDSYVRFLLEELLPEVEKKAASDGRPIRLSKSGNDRGIGGNSSGAIAAFTAAWERPNEFSRVFSAIGTYVALRGGNEYPSLLRKYEPKPLRIYLQSGENDNNLYAGDWWIANQMMERSLQFSGYDVQHTWGKGGHNGRQAEAIFPDVQRFLWKDWPAPVKNVAPTKNTFLAAMLIPGEDWKLVAEGFRQPRALTSNQKGNVFFADAETGKTYMIGPDGPVVYLENSRATGMNFGPDGKLYAAIPSEGKVVAYDFENTRTDVATGIRAEDVIVANNGNVYITESPLSTTTQTTGVYLVKPGSPRLTVDSDLQYPGGLTLSPDKTQLYVPEHRSHWVLAYQVQPDGSLRAKQRYGWLHVPDSADKSGAFGARVDRDGRIYFGTYVGLQVMDQLGRVNCILPIPTGRILSLTFGGEKFDTIYVTSGDKVFRRKLNIQGAPAWSDPIKPTAPRL